MGGPGWRWDPSLYAGSAAYYARGRMAYPTALVDALVAELGLDGSGRLLDVGCGPARSPCCSPRTCSAPPAWTPTPRC